jgi:murein L,D-transpeptidase YafK
VEEMALVKQTMERASQNGKDFDLELTTAKAYFMVRSSNMIVSSYHKVFQWKAEIEGALNLRHCARR